MPTTYAHYTFGNQVYQRLEPEMKTLIDRHRSLFLIGLQGPDILFYYHPFRNNGIVRIGNKIHQKPARIFFDRAVTALGRCSNREAGIVYLLGFLCHFLLDSKCHPIVTRKTENHGVPHNVVEKEFDRVLMLQDNLEPLSYKPTQHLSLSPGDAGIIACFYPGITDKKIKQSMRSMKRFLDLIVTPGPLKYGILKNLIHLVGKEKSFGGLLMNRQQLSSCAGSSAELFDTMNLLLDPSAGYVKDLFLRLTAAKNIDGNPQETEKSTGKIVDTIELDGQLERNFG